MSAPSPFLLEAKDVTRSFRQGGRTEDLPVLRGVSLQVKRGEFISIMGPSGSGKSTLLQILGSLDLPTSGTIEVDGQPLTSFNDDELSAFRRRRLGFIFQFFNLVPTLSALENVTLPMLLDGKSLSSVTEKARSLLKMVGLEHREHHRPNQLSGGEMQRVAIARALISEPLLLLADEPTGNLDTKTGESVLSFLRDLVQEHGHTLIMVTHDPKAANYGTRLIRVRDGLIESDTPVAPTTVDAC